MMCSRCIISICGPKCAINFIIGNVIFFKLYQNLGDLVTQWVITVLSLDNACYT